jgi:transposase
VSPLGRPKYTDEFKQDAVALVRSSGRAINDVARELGLCHETLRNWVRAGQGAARPAAAGQAVSVADKDAEIARLRAQVAELQVEKEILRKAAAFFAKEMDR